jgi:threonine dehydrogenase-like Zn-dependent dehydrogenase
MSSRNATRKDLEHVIRSLEDGKVNASSLITHRATFDQTISQFASWLQPDAGVIKALVAI